MVWAFLLPTSPSVPTPEAQPGQAPPHPCVPLVLRHRWLEAPPYFLTLRHPGWGGPKGSSWEMGFLEKDPESRPFYRAQVP